MMYTLAGIVISRASGTSWENFVQENLISPLEMGSISFDAPQLETFEGRAKGYRFFEDEALSLIHISCAYGKTDIIHRLDIPKRMLDKSALDRKIFFQVLYFQYILVHCIHPSKLLFFSCRISPAPF